MGREGRRNGDDSVRPVMSTMFRTNKIHSEIDKKTLEDTLLVVLIS